MIIYNSKYLKIKITKSGKGEPFHFKPLPVHHLDSMSEVRWQTDDLYLSTNYFVPLFIQIFWFWFIISVEIKKEKLSEMKMVRYEVTHYAMIDEALK